jgi:hypothetical protein
MCEAKDCNCEKILFLRNLIKQYDNMVKEIQKNNSTKLRVVLPQKMHSN